VLRSHSDITTTTDRSVETMTNPQQPLCNEQESDCNHCKKDTRLGLIKRVMAYEPRQLGVVEVFDMVGVLFSENKRRG
jgi:hypothetical protein